jgi:phenylpropionate dioxygenase-like ring-hydroxylating dioxygenase large terminal subunit
MTIDVTVDVRPSASYVLPSSAYTSQEWFDREQRELFGRTWQFAGMTSDVAQPGDYLAVDAGVYPLVVVRDDQRELRAFHNVCRHRGAKLFEGRGHAGRELRCFYHAWAYGLDGSLKRTPQAEQFGDLDRSCFGLLPASVETWKGMVFVHAEENPEPLTNWLGDFPAAMGPYEPEQLQELSKETFEVNANWKLFTENHIDGYHLWHLHKTSVVGFAHARQEWRPIGRHWTFREPPQRAGTSPTAQSGLRRIPGIDDEWLGSTVHLLFPNLGLASGGEYWLTLLMTPLAPDRTRVEVRTRAAVGGSIDKLLLGGRFALDAAWQRARRTAVGLAGHLGRNGVGRVTAAGLNSADDVSAEDKRAAEAVQAGMRSPVFSVGAMARDYESAITEFQRNIAHYVPLKP